MRTQIGISLKRPRPARLLHLCLEMLGKEHEGPPLQGVSPVLLDGGHALKSHLQLQAPGCQLRQMPIAQA